MLAIISYNELEKNTVGCLLTVDYTEERRLLYPNYSSDIDPYDLYGVDTDWYYSIVDQIDEEDIEDHEDEVSAMILHVLD